MSQLTAATNRNLLPLSDNDIRRLCPAVFAEAPRDDVSSRYGFVSTKDLLNAMRENGFVPTQVQSYYRRDPGNLEFTKHMVRFRPAGDNLKKLQKGDVVPQIALLNSHDRSSQFSLFGGLWRLVCENGLLVSEGSHVEPLVVRHTVSAIDGLLDATGELIKQQKYVFDHVDEMKKTTLTDKQAADFAVHALALRPERAGVIDPVQLLRVRRPEDEGSDIWHVYNRVQENLMRGGLQGITANNRAIVTRGVTSVNADVAINSGLWHLAVEAIDKARTSSAAAVRKGAKATAAEAAMGGERRAAAGRRATDAAVHAGRRAADAAHAAQAAAAAAAAEGQSA
jgi:hypothetical protein